MDRSCAVLQPDLRRQTESRRALTDEHRRDCNLQAIEHCGILEMRYGRAAAFDEKDETGMVNAVLDQLARQARPEEFGAG